MKQIRFRLIFDGKIVGYEFHYLGDLPQKETIVSQGDNIKCGIYHKRIGDEFYKNVLDDPHNFIPHDAKEQFIGHLDTYEGDIVRFDNTDIGGSVVIGEVIFNTDNALSGLEWGLWTTKGYHRTDFLGEIEILGNKWENPDLLEVEPDA